MGAGGAAGFSPPPSPALPKRREGQKKRLKEIPRVTRPKQRMSHSGDQQGYLLNLLLQSQNLNLKKQLQRRLRRYLRGRRGKLMQARMETILQKMEMPKQTRHRKLKVLGMPSELCEFLITVYFW
uniref:non-histone chromosomal protein HMG-17 isoform X1 n=1 Tax=Podarcis muralis TaxID=64176 RepID=UPI0010A062DA|nr:non-histone chromosomal protein HMG-17 isoform X1 [Podarcis muralis]